MIKNQIPIAALSAVIVATAPLTAMAQSEPAEQIAAAPEVADETISSAAPMAVPAPEMQAVLDKLAELGAKPLHTLTVEEARAQPTPADAVAAVMVDMGIDAGPAGDIATRDFTIPGPAGDIMARVYTPAGDGPFPVIVYYHGGGWVIADMDVYDSTLMTLRPGRCRLGQTPLW